MIRFLQIFLAASLLLGASRPAEARAAVSTSVKLRVIKLAQAGKRAFMAKKYQEALRNWRQAYSLWPKPQLLYNIALAYDGFGKPAQAMTFLRAFFKEARSQPQKPALMAEARKLESGLTPKTSVLGLSGHKGAQAFVDGKLVGTLPLEIVLLPGAHSLELRSPGRITVKRALKLPAGRTTLLDVQMVPTPRRPTLRPRPLVRPRPRPRLGPRPQPGPPPKGLHMAYALTAAGVAVALAGAAIGTGVLAVKRYDEFQDTPTLASRKRVKTLQDATNGLWAVAGTAGVAAVVLAIFTRWRSKRESSKAASALRLGTGPGGLGVTVHGRF